MQCSRTGGLPLGQELPIHHSGSCQKKKINLGKNYWKSQRTINGLLGLYQVAPCWSISIWNLHGLSFQLTTTLGSIRDLASLSGQKKWIKMWLRSTIYRGKWPCLPTIGPDENPVARELFHSDYSVPGWATLHGLNLASYSMENIYGEPQRPYI